MLENVRIVLVETSHPGNIGAVARAMKTMCLNRMYLVHPKGFPCADATVRAAGADDVLENACICGSLDEAIADCRLVVGASARSRTVHWPQLEPEACAAKVMQEAAAGQVALVFGRESSGLSNSELDRCQILVQIPTNPGFRSLNLGSAVQVLAYEIYKSSIATQHESLDGVAPVATAEMMEGFFNHLAQALGDIGFAHPNQSRMLLRRLRRLYQRARPDVEEINILRGILSAAQGRKSMRK